MLDLTQNPLENAQSLLEDARANRRRQDRDWETVYLLLWYCF